MESGKNKTGHRIEKFENLIANEKKVGLFGLMNLTGGNKMADIDLNCSIQIHTLC